MNLKNIYCRASVCESLLKNMIKRGDIELEDGIEISLENSEHIYDNPLKYGLPEQYFHKVPSVLYKGQTYCLYNGVSQLNLKMK